MTEESPRKRPKLSCEDEVDSLCKPDLLEHIRKQEEYITELQSRLASSFQGTSSDGEDKARHLKAARREQLLVMRLTTKEQELHELANQLADKTQNASTAQLRSALVDPALNLMIQRLKKELEDKTTALQQAHEDMAAWKFTPDSQTGKRLMARCRTLIKENQELGKQVSQGKVAQMEAELALQKAVNDELKTSQDEMYEMVMQLNDEGEGMQSTILALQKELKDKQHEIPRDTGSDPGLGGMDNSTAAPLPPENAEVNHEPQSFGSMQQDKYPEDFPQGMPARVNAESEPGDACQEPMEQEEATGQEKGEKIIPAVRTTECNEAETPVAMEEDTPVDVSTGPTEKDGLSVDPWSNPSHFVESPASPVEEEGERTPQGFRGADRDFRTQAPSEGSTVGEEEEERDIPSFQRGDSPERTTESSGPEQMEADSGQIQPAAMDCRQNAEQREDDEHLESEAGEEQHQFRTPMEESSQDSTLGGDVREDETEDGSRTGEKSGSPTQEFSTNGESHPEAIVNMAQNNGEAEQLFVNKEYGRVGEEDVERSYEIQSNTLVRDTSTYEPVVEGETNSLDNRSDITDKQSDTTEKQSDISDKQSDISDKQSDTSDRQSQAATTDNNNGLSNAGECVNSGRSSPIDDELSPLGDGEYARTENVIKSLNSNAHGESPVGEEGLESEQCDGEDTVIPNSVPPTTNSAQEEISV